MCSNIILLPFAPKIAPISEPFAEGTIDYLKLGEAILQYIIELTPQLRIGRFMTQHTAVDNTPICSNGLNSDVRT